MSSSSKWNSADDEILIDFVRSHEAIYNIKSKEYRKTQLKQNLWREIGDFLNKTDSDCSKRWCYIRDYYIRRKGKPGTGSSGEAARKRADLLSFLDRLPSSQRSSLTSAVDENLGDISVITEKTHNNSEETPNTHNNNEQTQNTGIGNIKVEITYNDSEETQSNTDEIENFICVNDYENDGNAKSDKKRKNAQAQDLLANHSTQNGLDETDLFFSSMAKIVKKLSRYEQAKLRMQIGSLVGNAELRHISNHSPQSKYPSLSR